MFFRSNRRGGGEPKAVAKIIASQLLWRTVLVLLYYYRTPMVDSWVVVGGWVCLLYLAVLL